MAILVLHHSRVAGPGRLAATLRDSGVALDARYPHEFPIGHERGLPRDLAGVHGLVILGGPQNVTDIGKYTWMQHEAGLVAAAHARELPIVGICLGCQLIGHALGGVVTAKSKSCMGFYPVSATVAGQTETILGGVQWNFQTFFACGQEVSTLPPGATLLHTSAHTKHAAFRVGVRTYAFQYHFECDKPLVEAIVTSSKPELAHAGTTEGEVRVQLDAQYDTFARVSDRISSNLAAYCVPLSRKLSA